MRKLILRGLSAATAACGLMAAQPALVGGAGMPWEGPLQKVVESAYRADAVSTAGAVGLTQLMPRTAAALGVADSLEPAATLSAGADYLARQILRFGDLRLALAAYAGPERVEHRCRLSQA